MFTSIATVIARRRTLLLLKSCHLRSQVLSWLCSFKLTVSGHSPLSLLSSLLIDQEIEPNGQASPACWPALRPAARLGRKPRQSRQPTMASVAARSMPESRACVQIGARTDVTHNPALYESPIFQSASQQDLQPLPSHRFTFLEKCDLGDLRGLPQQGQFLLPSPRRSS